MINALSALLLVLFGFFFFRSLIGNNGNFKAKMEEAKRKAAEHKERARAEHDARDKVGAEDMRQCAVCEDYIPMTATSNCGREGCPY